MTKQPGRRLSHLFILALLVILQLGCLGALPKSFVRTHYLSENPSTDEKIAHAIQEDRLLLGMKHSEVYMTWGRPDLVQFADGREQWWWQRGQPDQHKVMFGQNGQVLSWVGQNPWPDARLFPPSSTSPVQFGPRK